MKSPLFYSKILLFGEYGIIKDSKGLAIPYNYYNGMLKFEENTENNPQALTSNEKLSDYAAFLDKISQETPPLVTFNMQQLREDIARGMYFDSSIPQGYGLGSSGALVAALYDKYANERIPQSRELKQAELLQLKAIFSKMESYFHGKSSGLDPLNSYLALPLLIHSQDSIVATDIPKSSTQGQGAVFLLDSGIVGETAPMVQIFMEKMKHQGFRTMLKNKFSRYTDACIEDFLQGNYSSLVANVKELSKVVIRNFKPMIPEPFHELWQKGIDSGDYFLKLCGSGGGGYILGFTSDLKKAEEALKGHKIQVVYQF